MVDIHMGTNVSNNIILRLSVVLACSCFDRDGKQCVPAAALGSCSTSPFMFSTTCQLSCGACAEDGPSCADVASDCDVLASSGSGCLGGNMESMRAQCR